MTTQRRRRVLGAGLALILIGVAGPITVSASAGAAGGSIQVVVASTGGNGYFSKPGFLPFDPLFYGTAPRTQAQADTSPSAHGLAAFLDPAGSLSRGVNGNLNIIGAPPLPVDPSYPYFAEARYPTAPESTVGVVGPEGAPDGATPGKATATASPEGVATAEARGGSFSAPLGEAQHFGASGVEGRSLADAVKAVGETMAVSTDVDLGGVFKARSVKVLARVERQDGKLLGTGSVQVSGATLNDIPVEFNEKGLLVNGQPAGETPDGAALLDSLADQGITVIPPRIDVSNTDGSVGVKVFAPSLRIAFTMEQPVHEVDVIGLESGYASAALTVGAEEGADSGAPTDYADLYQPPAETAEAPTTPAAGPAATEESLAAAAPAFAAGTGDSGGGSTGFSPDTFSPSGNDFSAGNSPAMGTAGPTDTESSPAAGETWLEAGTSASTQAIGSVSPAGIRDSTRNLLVALWVASMVALLAAAAWQRGAAPA